MSVNFKTLYQGVLTGTAAATYAPGTAIQGAAHTVNLWNPTAAAVTVNFYLVPSGGTANDTTRLHQLQVAAGKSVMVPEVINAKVVNPTALYADGAGVTLTITGTEVTP
ncbi:hypothetical protein [Burkholderia pseudomultivorans]|uniref:hypothetical protein n=1 Tax=Burkholderia pseudomultivorans TaxID=1207504 RepID=UPI0008415DC3|nr:hypothetical protein [Burkholderia pseudomultivorans]AOI92111.1 hypothetical protein WS57_25720 [Burkholderia pseudomultivorans]